MSPGAHVSLHRLGNNRGDYGSQIFDRQKFCNLGHRMESTVQDKPNQDQEKFLQNKFLTYKKGMIIKHFLKRRSIFSKKTRQNFWLSTY